MKIEEIKVGDKLTTQLNELYEIKEIIGEGLNRRYVAYFPASGNWQIVYPQIAFSRRFRDSSKPYMYGIGYSKGTKENPATASGGEHVEIFHTWYGMLGRCYGGDGGKRNYKDVWVCEEWHNYMNFKQWYIERINTIDKKYFALDKDLFGDGKRIYSPQTCCLIPQEINSCITAIKSFENYAITETSAKSVYVLSKLLNKYQDHLEARVIDRLSNFIRKYSIEYKKVTGVSLGTFYKIKETPKANLSDVKLTAFIEYDGRLLKFQSAEEIKTFIKKIEKEQIFKQKVNVTEKRHNKQE